MKQCTNRIVIISIVALFVVTGIGIQRDHFSVSRTEAKKAPTFDDLIVQNADQMMADGKHTFRFDTFRRKLVGRSTPASQGNCRDTNVLNLVTTDAIAPLPSHRWGEEPHVKKLNAFVIDHARDSLLDVLNQSRVYLLRS